MSFKFLFLWFHLDWCPLQNQYNRLARMCMYFELDPNKMVSSWSTADSACITMGMRLASNLTPPRMDALWNMTKKNDGNNTKIFQINIYFHILSGQHQIS